MLNIQTIINLIKQKYSNFETFIITYNACKNIIYIICLSYKRFYFASRRYSSRSISQSSFCTDMYRDSAESDKWNPPWNMLVGSTYLPSQIIFIKYQIQSLLQLYAMFSYTLSYVLLQQVLVDIYCIWHSPVIQSSVRQVQRGLGLMNHIQDKRFPFSTHQSGGVAEEKYLTL